MIKCPYCGSLSFMQFDDGPLECIRCERPWFSKGMHGEAAALGSTELHIWPESPDIHR